MPFQEFHRYWGCLGYRGCPGYRGCLGYQGYPEFPELRMLQVPQGSLVVPVVLESNIPMG